MLDNLTLTIVHLDCKYNIIEEDHPIMICHVYNELVVIACLEFFFLFPEHKNMPLDDAIGLINRDYDRYCQTIRNPRLLGGGAGGGAGGGGGGGAGSGGGRGGGGEARTATSLMAKAAAGHNLSPDELNLLITSLQQKQQQEGGGQRREGKGKLNHIQFFAQF